MQDDLLEQALCKGAEDDVFHAPGEEDLPPDSTRTFHSMGGQVRALQVEWELTAKVRYCVRCPVRPACLLDGMTEREGIYGGLTPGDRQNLREGRPIGITPEKIRANASAKRDTVVQLMQDGEDIDTITAKTGMSRKRVYISLREHLALSP